MAEQKSYKTASALRTALSERLNREGKERKIEVQKLSRQVAFDRLLARIFSEPAAPFVLKGGYAMHLRVQNARETRDVDLSLRDAKILSSEPKEQSEAIFEFLRKAASKGLGDFFEFVISPPTMELSGAPYGGSRFHVEAKLDGRSFEKFLLDVGVGDVWIEPTVKLKGQGWLEFAGIHALKYPAISAEQQFAEKIHAYTLPRDEGRPNSRVKDLVDMVLLIQTEEISSKQLDAAIEATFKRRATHDFNPSLARPPTAWTTVYAKLADECDISPEIETGFKIVQEFVAKLSG